MPEHILPDGLAVILTLAAPAAVTAIVRVLDVAGDPVAQVALDVMTHFIASALASVLELKVVLLVPTFTPFSFH